MAKPRHKQIDLENGGFVHLGARCVRQAYICGFDSLTGKDFSHRRTWIEQRLLFLASVFSVEIFGYSILDNHYHLLANFLPTSAKQWSNEEVARRWLRLYPKKCPEAAEEFIQNTASNLERTEELRNRLSSSPYFMKELNQYIARLANHEDGVSGAFWSGRYFSKALRTEEDIVTCLAYVDLNPVRAGMVSDPESPNQQTSLIRRLEELEALRSQRSDCCVRADPEAGEDSNADDAETTKTEESEPSESIDRPMRPLVRGEGALVARSLESGTKLPIDLNSYRHRTSVLAQHGAGKSQHKSVLSRAPPSAEPWLNPWLERLKGFRRRTPAKTPLYWWMASS